MKLLLKNSLHNTQFKDISKEDLQFFAELNYKVCRQIVMETAKLGTICS